MDKARGSDSYNDGKLFIKLTDGLKTAIATLRCHALESGKHQPIIPDPMAEFFLDKLVSLVSEEDKTLLFNRKLSTVTTSINENLS